MPNLPNIPLGNLITPVANRAALTGEMKTDTGRNNVAKMSDAQVADWVKPSGYLPNAPGMRGGAPLISTPDTSGNYSIRDANKP